jgi:ATP-dependent RNA helicase RhlE
MPFTSLGLSRAITKGVSAAGYTAPTPIQTQAIPQILERKDLIGTAQTGTGKTAAFVLPILHRVHADKGLRCLVLTPTRELAAQIESNIKKYSRFMRVWCTTVYGGVSIGPQINSLKRKPQFVVATPGRLLDLINRGCLNLKDFGIFVLDEADRMLDMGFMPDIRKITKMLPDRRQNLLFSATMPQEIESLARQTLRDPLRITIGAPTTPVEKISQYTYPVPHYLKMSLLRRILQESRDGTVLIFTRTKHRADKVARMLNRNDFKATQMHGDRSQSQRTQALEGFRSGRYRIMVATDIAARGLDVKGISHVINYDVPETAEAYVHRIGRTARADTYGDAFTLVGRNEEETMCMVERQLKLDLPRIEFPDFDYRAPAPEPQRNDHSGRKHYKSGKPRHGKNGSSARNSRNGNRKNANSRNGRSSNKSGLKPIGANTR